MTYETIAAASQVFSLVMVGAMFVIVFAYVLWPANRQRFDDAQRKALDLDPTSKPRGRAHE
jgi:cbb3-type cytochrome oxidase subunit 3